MDEVFSHPRLAAVYDALDPGRSDLVPTCRLPRRSVGPNPERNVSEHA